MTMGFFGDVWGGVKKAGGWLGDRLGGGGPQMGDYVDTRTTPYLPPGQMNPGGGGMPGSNPIAAPYQAGATPDFSKVKGSEGVGSRVGGWLRDNSDLVLGAAGLGLQAYGAHQAGEAEDKRMALDEEMMRSDQANTTRALDLREQEMLYQQQEDERERKRRRQAIQNVLRMRAQGAQPPTPPAGS
jgi:hypothetical protein